MSTKHSKAAKAYLQDDAVVTRHDQTFFGVRQKRDRMAQALPEWEDLREAANLIKKHTETHLADYLEQFEQNAIKNGVHVHWAQDADEYNQIVFEILSQHNVKKVVKSEKGMGNQVTVEHAGGFQTLYAHLNSIKVSEGQNVRQGTVIGTVGQSGSCFAPCLHYEVLRGGIVQEPVNYFFAELDPATFHAMMIVALTTGQSMD